MKFINTIAFLFRRILYYSYDSQRDVGVETQRAGKKRKTIRIRVLTRIYPR